MKRKKYILILGASSDQTFMIKTAKDMGLGTVVLDGNKNAPGLNIADIAEPLDFSQINKTIDFVSDLKQKHINLCGVNTMGSDIPDIVSKISRYFKWIGPNEQTAQIATNKLKMKQHFIRGGIQVPLFKLVQNTTEITKIWNGWKSEKIIIKPTDRSGARGVSVVSQENDIKNAFNEAIINSNVKEVIIEEFVDGPQVSTESILYDGKSFTPGFADRVYNTTLSFYPHVIENGGWVPSNLPKEQIKKIKELVENASKYLGINKGTSKGDVVIHPKKGPMIIEIAARLSGGDFCESLVPLSSGVNYVQDALKISIGEPPNWESLLPKKDFVVANRYFFLPEGRLEQIINFEKARLMNGIEKLEIFFKEGDLIPRIDSHAKRIGVFIVKATTRKEAQNIIDNIYEEVLFKVDGDWKSGDPSLFFSQN
jgi:biotin carboxylase